MRGSYEYKITIQELTGEVRQTSGTLTGGTWTEYAQRWAAKSYSGAGTEGMEANKETAIQTVVFDFDYVSGLTPKMRILDSDGQVFDIYDVQETKRSFMHRVHTKERR